MKPSAVKLETTEGREPEVAEVVEATRDAAEAVRAEVVVGGAVAVTGMAVMVEVTTLEVVAEVVGREERDEEVVVEVTPEEVGDETDDETDDEVVPVVVEEVAVVVTAAAIPPVRVAKVRQLEVAAAGRAAGVEASP